MADEVKLIDAKLLTTNIAQIAKNCARSDAQKALIGRILFMTENMPTVETEPDNGWISVKDRLPDGDGNFYEGGLEESKYVLVYGCYEDNYGYGIGTYIRDHIDHDAGWSGCLSGVYELDCCNVTHWQHLPEPPKGE